MDLEFNVILAFGIALFVIITIQKLRVLCPSAVILLSNA